MAVLTAMAILRFDPFRDPFRDLDRITNQLMSGTRMPNGMPMDVYKRGNAWHVEMDLPGISLFGIAGTLTGTARVPKLRQLPAATPALLRGRLAD